MVVIFFFFNDTATTEIYTLSLHDALPISTSRIGQICPILLVEITSSAARPVHRRVAAGMMRQALRCPDELRRGSDRSRSEEHTSELQSRQYLVCRLLLEKKKNHKPYG